MKIEFDPDADAMYIRLRNGRVISTRSLDDSRYVDLGANGQPIGVEVLGVSQGIDTTDLPEREAIEQALGKLGTKVLAA